MWWRGAWMAVIAAVSLVPGPAPAAPRRDWFMAHTPGERRCLQRLRELAILTKEYVENTGDRMPPMHSGAAFRRALKGFRRGADCFVCPVTGKPYALNAALSRRRSDQMGRRHDMLLAWDSKTHAAAGPGRAFMWRIRAGYAREHEALGLK